MRLGEKIVHLREAKGWSTGKLCEESGVSRAYLWQLETGGKDNPSFEVLEKLARALGVNVSEFSAGAQQTASPGELPPGLQEFFTSRGAHLGVRSSDIEVMRNVNFRGEQPKKPEDWELLFLFLQKWVR